MGKGHDPLLETSLTDRIIDGLGAFIVAGAVVVAGVTHPGLLLAVILVFCVCGAAARVASAAQNMLKRKDGHEAVPHKQPRLS